MLAVTKLLRRWALPVVLAVIILVSPSINLMLLEHPIKYKFYVFELCLIGLLFFAYTSRSSYKFKLRKITWIRVTDYFLLICSATLLTLNILPGFSSITRLVSAIIVSFFLPGWALLRLLGVCHQDASPIESIVLSFALSVGLTPLIFGLTLFTENQVMIMCAVYVGLSLIPLFRVKFSKSNLKRTYENSGRGEHSFFNILILIAASLFLIFTISTLYPQESDTLLGADIIRHFSATKLLLLNPDIYASQYPWFHFAWATVYALSTPLMEAFQTGLAYLSLMVVLSFYIMAKTYLHDLDKRIPALATVFWAVFSGFGWLYFLQQKIVGWGSTHTFSQFDLLHQVGYVSYLDVGLGQGWLWFWFRPLTLGFTLFFTLIYLMRREDLSRRNFLVLYSLLISTLGLIHISELFFFSFFIFALALIHPGVRLRLKETVFSVFVGVFVLLLFMFCQDLSGFVLLDCSFPYLLLSGVLAAVAYLLVRSPRRPSIRLEDKIAYIVLAALLFYSALLAYWLTNADSLPVREAYAIYGVPWEFYPVLLGVGGLLAFAGVVFVVKQYRRHPIIIFVILFIVAIFAGRILTYTNATLMNTGYIEKRIIPFVYSASCILAALAVSKAIKKCSKGSSQFLVATLISFVVISGMTSTLLTIEYRIYLHRYSLTDMEKDAIRYLDTVPPTSNLLTIPSGWSRSVAEFAPLQWIIGTYRYQLWPNQNPELPLTVLSSRNNIPIIYLSLYRKDYAEIRDKYDNSYIANHLVPLGPLAYNNSEINIVQLPELAPPTSHSNTILVTPDGVDPDIWYAYDILSLGRYNYTTALLSDINTLKEAEVIIAPTEEVALKVIEYTATYNLRPDKLIILNIDGYEKLAEQFFIGPYQTVSLDNDSALQAHLQCISPYAADMVTSITRLISPQSFLVAAKSNDPNPYILAEDNSSNEWRIGGMGSGNVSICTLEDDSKLKASGSNSLAIIVGKGKYAYWQIIRNLPKAQDLSSFDFISFYWLGKGDNKRYVVQINTDEAGKNFWYSFQDGWMGWKKVLLPMHVPDGEWDFAGVHFEKVTNKGAQWNRIKAVDIHLEDSNPNMEGTYHLDRLGFEHGLWVNASAKYEKPLKTLNVSVHNSTSWLPIASFSSNTTKIMRDISFGDGFSARKLYGNGEFAILSYTNLSDQTILKFSIKLPPLIESTSSSSVLIELEPILTLSHASAIEGLNGSITLPYNFSVTPLVPSTQSSAKYSSGVPFSLTEERNGYELHYINIYPVIKYLKSGSEKSRELYSVLGMMFNVTDIDLPHYHGIRSYAGIKEGETLFAKATLEGEITVNSTSIILSNEQQPVTISVDGNIMTFDQIFQIHPVNFTSVEVKTDKAKIEGGVSFYSRITMNQTVVSILGNPASLLICLNNNSRSILEGNCIIISCANNTMLARQQTIIQLEGNASFSDFSAYWKLEKVFHKIGEDVMLSGIVTFTLEYGDIFSLARNWTGSFEGGSPTYEYRYNELTAIRSLLPFVILISLFSVVLWLSRLFKERTERT